MSIADKLTTIADNMQKVYEAGKAQGADNWYDTFWDEFQQSGNRTNYSKAFCSGTAADGGKSWTNVIFKPKYSMVDIVGYEIFDYSRIEGSLSEILADLGISLTFSGYQSSGFQSTQFTEVDYINSNMTTMARVFKDSTKLRTLKISTVKETTVFNDTFYGCVGLENLTIEGTIGTTGFDVSDCVFLLAESYNSIMTHLSTTASFTITLPAEDTVRSVYDATYGDGAWDLIVAEYSNVTIVYS